MAIKRGRWMRAIAAGVLVVLMGLYALCALFVLALRWIDPPTTTVQIQRRLEAMRRHHPYKKLYVFVPLHRIAPDRQHHGFDWVEMQKVLEDDIKRGRLGRGGSTITQQLVKNLFLTTERSLIRKAAEFAVVPMVEALLTKDRILEL